MSTGPDFKRRKFGHLGILFTLSLFVLAGSIQTASGQILRPGDLKVSEVRRGDQLITVFKITGSIAYPMAHELKEAFEKMSPESKRVLLHLNSGGGSVQEGLEIIGLLRLKKREGYKIDSTVHNGEICGSMCVPLFVQGERRYAGEVSAFMFHGVVKHGFTNVPDEERTRSLINLFFDAGVSRDWISLMWERKAFSTPGSYWLTGQQLLNEKSNIVNFLLPAHDVEEPWHAPLDPNIRPR